ncbi:MAG: hypothetical protein RQ752_01295 [Thermohalobaculum sp.]|nr:hypothetical protein [Thermohalobaculum sp.]
MIAGPYTAGAADDAARAANLAALNRAAAAVLAKGHVPLVGVNLALPVIAAAGPDSFGRIMMPLSLALAARCDAVLRIGGASEGADREVALIGGRGGQVFHSLDAVPPAR